MDKSGEHRLACADIVKTLRYFSVFSHPLMREEIWDFASCHFSPEILNACLTQLVEKEIIFQFGEYFLPENQPAWVEQRIKAETLARKKMNKARLSARIIAHFPFVRSVCISGSLSKGVAKPRSDIDFFIITAEDRLWICRTILHLFKKLSFLAGSQHAFCMNYFLDESHLILEEKNRFTATELTTLIPMYGFPAYQRLMQRNECWIQLHLPHQSGRAAASAVPCRTPWIKKGTEKLLSFCFPHQLNQYLLQLTDRKWRKKWQKKQFPMDDYDLALKTKWYVSKQHPLNYQKQVMEKWKPS